MEIWAPSFSLLFRSPKVHGNFFPLVVQARFLLLQHYFERTLCSVVKALAQKSYGWMITPVSMVPCLYAHPLPFPLPFPPLSLRTPKSENKERGVKPKVSRAGIAIAMNRRVDSSVVKKRKMGGGVDPPHGQANGGSLSPDKMRIVIKSTLASNKIKMGENDGVKGKGANEDVGKCGLGLGVGDDAETPARKAAKAPSTKRLADRKRGATKASIGSSAVPFADKGTEGGGDSAAGLPSSAEKALKRMPKKRFTGKIKPDVADIFRIGDDAST